jgi:hypothetical protein
VEARCCLPPLQIDWQRAVACFKCGPYMRRAVAGSQLLVRGVAIYPGKRDRPVGVAELSSCPGRPPLASSLYSSASKVCLPGMSAGSAVSWKPVRRVWGLRGGQWEISQGSAPTHAHPNKRLHLTPRRGHRGRDRFCYRFWFLAITHSFRGAGEAGR